MLPLSLVHARSHARMHTHTHALPSFKCRFWMTHFVIIHFRIALLDQIKSNMQKVHSDFFFRYISKLIFLGFSPNWIEILLLKWSKQNAEFLQMSSLKQNVSFLFYLSCFVFLNLIPLYYHVMNPIKIIAIEWKHAIGNSIASPLQISIILRCWFWFYFIPGWFFLWWFTWKSSINLKLSNTSTV